MSKISGLGLRDKQKYTKPFTRQADSQFSKQLMLAKAGGLLRNTGQLEKWTALRQTNDDLALETANILLNRHELLEKAKQGQEINWATFDELSEKLKIHNIHLYKSIDLFLLDPGLAQANYKKQDSSKLSLPSPYTEYSVSNNSSVKANGVDKNLSEPKNDIINLVDKSDQLDNSEPSKDKIKIKDNKSFEFSDATLVVLSVGYKNFILNNSLVGYGDSKKVMLPLSDISRHLDFNIDVDAENGTAAGYFISENRKFDLNLPENKVVIEEKYFDLPGDGIERKDGELYVDTKLLSEWFPVDFNYNFSTQSVGIIPRERLPFQARIEREQAWRNINGSQVGQTIFPRKESEYELLSMPVVDLGLTGSFIDGKKSDDGFGGDFNVIAKGDLGKMTAELYLSGDDEDGLNNTRLTLRRDDPDGNLLGPLKATSIAIGDIREANIPIVGGGQTQRGISISNEEMNRPREFDFTFFEGNLPPGWDVEVYRNKALVRSQRVGTEGKYSFDKIPIYYGKNDFKLMFYGPQGQERVETKSINVGNDLLQKGKSEYKMTLSQKNTSVYDPDKIDGVQDDEALKLNATYNYGLSKNLSLGTGISSQKKFAE